jgi:hypothetical protein
LRKTEARDWIDEQTKKLSLMRWQGDYVLGFKEGCMVFLDWLVQQGVIKQ